MIGRPLMNLSFKWFLANLRRYHQRFGSANVELVEARPGLSARRVGVVDGDIAGGPDHPGTAASEVVPRPVVQSPAGGELQPRALHATADRGLHPTAQRMQLAAEIRAVAVLDVDDLAAVGGTKAEQPPELHAAWSNLYTCVGA